MALKPIKVAVIGSGPAGLMAADVLGSAGMQVSLFERRKGPAWKLYIAGSSGLNISNSLALADFARQYTGPATHWSEALQAFPPSAWLQFIEKDLGLGTFLGTSERYFVETMHAAQLVRRWRRRLADFGVQFHFDHESLAFDKTAEAWRLSFRQAEAQEFAALCFCLGGASYEADLSSLAWPAMFAAKGVSLKDFAPANSGYEVAWPAKFIEEAEGLALKNIDLRTSQGAKRGDLIITQYGLEGTPIYTFGCPGTAYIDLKPDLSAAQLRGKLLKSRENFSWLRRAHKLLNLNPAAKALLFHLAPPAALENLESLLQNIKNLPIELQRPRPLQEAISSKGGVKWDQLDTGLMLLKYPGVFLAGEMLDWEAPTGGFLIQGCVSQGFWAAQQILHYGAGFSSPS